MLSKSDKRDIELMKQLKKATSVQEILETAKALNWDFSEHEAREFLGQTTPEKKSPSKGISQEAINTLLDLSITTEEALDKSAEITIKEAEQGRPTWDDFFSVESREEKIALLDKMFGGSLTPEEIERFLAIE